MLVFDSDVLDPNLDTALDIQVLDLHGEGLDLDLDIQVSDLDSEVIDPDLDIPALTLCLLMTLMYLCLSYVAR